MKFDGIDCGGMTADFADKIAQLESRSNCIDNQNDYRCVNKKRTAYGRYQMQRGSLIDTGYMNRSGQFTGRDGIKSYQDFLDNANAQEQAMCDYMNIADRSYENNNVYDKYENKILKLNNKDILLDRDTLLSLSHRWGPTGGRLYLQELSVDKKNGNYMYDPQICYDYFAKAGKNKVKENICNDLSERLYKLNE